MLSKLFAGSVIVLQAGTAFAGPLDFTPITSAFTAGEVVTAVMAVAAVLAVIYVAMKGARIVLSMLRGN